MFKKNTAVFILIIFICTILPFSFFQKVNAYTSNAYVNNLKVGLTSMSATSIKITLDGDYSLNGQAFSSGSVLNLEISGTDIILNGNSQTEINLVPSGENNLLTITSGTITNKYMGSFLMKVYNAKILPINIIDVENYLKGVVGYEMSDYFPIEALKAQAVAARNYALSKTGYEVAKGYDFDDTIKYQVYKGYNANHSRVIKAVEETKGQVLLYNDKLAETLYSAWHGGISENSENVWGNTVPYLRSVVDTYENDLWPNGNIVLTDADIQSRLITKGLLAATDTFVSLDLTSITNFESGRVSNINIIYKSSSELLLTKAVTRDNARSFLSLPSNFYTVTYDLVSGAYTFSGRGNGHGLGMSQIGAKNRATAGQTYEEILKFYYQNTYLQNLIAKVSLSTGTEITKTVFVGDAISLNSTAVGGNGGGYLFKYVVKNGSDIVFTKEYSNTSKLDFVPNNVGSYTVETYVKEKSSVADYDDKKESFLTVLSSPKIISFQPSKAQYLAGESINLKATATLGSGSYLYKYVISKGGVTLSTSDYKSAGDLQYVAEATGTYSITVYLKDALSKNEVDAQSTLNIDVYKPQLSKITATGSFYQGKPLTLKGSNIDANSSGFSYKYEVYKGKMLFATKDFNKSSAFSFTATDPGIYTVKVYGKDVLSSNAYDSMKQFSITIIGKPLYLSKLPLKYGITSNDVKSLQSALVKLGYSIPDKSGYFGTQTKNVVISFQKSKGLTKDGIVGTSTYNAINEALIQKSGIKTLTY